MRHYNACPVFWDTVYVLLYTKSGTFSTTESPNSAIVAVNGDNLSPNSATVAEFGDCCRKRRLSPNCRQCGQGFTLTIDDGWWFLVHIAVHIYLQHVFKVSAISRHANFETCTQRGWHQRHVIQCRDACKCSRKVGLSQWRQMTAATANRISKIKNKSIKQIYLLLLVLLLCSTSSIGVARNLCWGGVDNRGAEIEIETSKASRGRYCTCPPAQVTRRVGGTS